MKPIYWFSGVLVVALGAAGFFLGRSHTLSQSGFMSGAKPDSHIGTMPGSHSGPQAESTTETSNDPTKNRVVVYSYSSFVGSWSAGPELAQAFQKKTGRIVEWVDAGDSRLILQRLELEAENSRADVVVGLDQWSLLQKRVPWRSLASKIRENMVWSDSFPKAYQDLEFFFPFDWAPLSLIYRKSDGEPPNAISELISEKYEKALSLADPRTSTNGFQFLFWLYATSASSAPKTTEGKIPPVQGEHETVATAKWLQSLSPVIFAISPNWSSAYGLFKNRQAKFVFSYVTSAVYHWINDKTEDYQAAVFRNPLPYQVEFAAIPQRCHNCIGAEEFLKFMGSEEAQSLLMNKNFMLPIREGIKKGTAFEKLPEYRLVDSAQYPPQNNLSEEFLLDLWKKNFH